MAQDQVSCKFLHQGAISRSAALSSYNWDAFAPGSWGFGTRGAHPVIVLFASQFNACAPFDALEQTAQAVILRFPQATVSASQQPLLAQALPYCCDVENA
jgi:hypothetical protein